MRKLRIPNTILNTWMPWLRWCSSSLIVVGMNIFCLVRQHISSLSIPPLPLEVFRDNDIVSAVSDIIPDDCADTRTNEKLDRLSALSQKNIPWCIAVAIPTGI